MNSKHIFLSLLISCFFSAAMFSQGPVVKLNYMKVTPGMESDYLEVEQEWKRIHQKKIELGICDGWQLWRKLYSGTDDAYNYIAIDWYKDFPSTFESYPDDFIEGLMTEKELDELFEKTGKSRSMVRQELSYRIMVADDEHSSSKYIVLNRMRVKDSDNGRYLETEEKIWKPIHEKSIEKGSRTHWAVWGTWPLQEGQGQYVTIDGYATPEQFVADDAELKEVHPEMTWEEVNQKTLETRKLISNEVWELVDGVFPE